MAHQDRYGTLDTDDKLLDGPAKGKKKDERFAAIRKRKQLADDACLKLYADAVDDFKFAWIPGNQWDTAMSTLRGKRPKYEFNNLRQAIKQVLNDNRQNTPSIKVAATEDSDVELAEMREGIIRNIESQSNADSAYDWGALYAITSGFGCWRVVTEYTDDDSFEQDIRIRRIENPFSVKFDPAARKLDRSDARYVFIEQDMPRSVFKAKYPDADYEAFESGKPGWNKEYAHWCDKDTIRVCEYWHKTRKKKKIYQLSDGRVVDAEAFDLIADKAKNPPPGPDGTPGVPITVKAKRTVEYDEINSEILSGCETLEGPFKWAGKYIPVVPCWGDIVNVDGADYFYGIVRPSRDAQVLFNFSQSNLVEVVASQPRAPWLYTPKMLEGHEEAWKRSAVDNPVGLPFNVDESAPGGKPSREAPPQFATAWFELSRINSENIKSTSGIYDASLGARSNETSGIAISNRTRQSGLANFDYQDNIAKAVQFTGVIVSELMEHIYDTERDLRILGADQQSKYIRINKPVYRLDDGTEIPAEEAEQMQLPPGEWVKVNDISVGKYDITITTGPSFTTQRMETAATLTEIAKNPNPQIAALASYGVMKNLDVPGLEEITKGVRTLLVGQKLLEPSEKDPPPQGPPPEVQAIMQQIQEQGAALQQEKAALDAQKAEMEGEAAKLQAAHTSLNAEFGQKKAELENMILRAQGAQEGAQSAPAPVPAASAPSAAGDSAVAYAVAQSLSHTLERTEAVAATLAQAEQAAERIEQAAQMTMVANTPKERRGTMARQPDGSYAFVVVDVTPGAEA